MTDLLFEPITINGMEVKNRIFMPAMHLNMCRNFEVSDRLIRFYAERARGGAGMITVGYASVDEFSAHPAHIGAHRDEFIPGLEGLAAAIREGGARASVQLNHAGRYNHSMLLGGRKPVAPSAIPSRLTGETPVALETDQIREIVECFAQAAGRVQRAGFDAVEILAGTGYLISEFLSEVSNRRTDEYGGPLENRMRFGHEVVRAVREAVGPGSPLLVRLNGNDFMPGGNGSAELAEFASSLVEAGADALCVNVGWHEARIPQIVTKVPRGVFGYLARNIRERVDVPVIASHRINDPATAREMIADGLCDGVAMGRALIADPRLPKKARTGREEEILHCVACGQGCFDNLFRMKAVECLCNPQAGYEEKRSLRPAEGVRCVLVVGGGAAGMSAALAAAGRGHKVTIYEKSERLGGQLHLAGAPPGREEFTILARDLARKLEPAGVRVKLGSQVDPAVIEAENPDAVVLASGGTSLTPSIPGVDRDHVVQAWELLAGNVRAGERVVVIGGGAVGVETALALAEEGTLSAEALKFLLVHGAEKAEDLQRMAIRGTREIVLVEMLEKIGTNFGRSTRWGMLQDLERFGIRVLKASRAVEITENGLSIEREGTVEEIPADTVVLAAGTRPHNPLQSILTERSIPFTIVGDARQVGMAIDAIHQGFLAGCDIG